MLMYFSARSSSDLLKSLSCILDIQFSQNFTLNPNSWFIIHYMEWQRCTHPLIHKYILHCNLRQSFGSNSSHWIQFSFDAQRGSPKKKKSWKNSISSFCKWMPHAPPPPWFWFAHGQGYNLITLFGILLFIHVRLQSFVPFSALNLFLIRKNDLRQIGFNQEWKILRVDALNVFFVNSCQIVVFPLGFLEFQK